MPSPAQIAWAKFRVLVTSIAALSILAVLVYLLTGGGIFEPKIPLRTYLPDATGMARRAPVRLNGVLVGKVDSVRLSGSNDADRVIEVRMWVRQRFLAEIPEDSETDVSAETAIGDLFINIRKGKSPRPIAAGGVLRHQPEASMMSRIDMRAFEARLREIGATLDDIERGKGPLGELLQTEELYRKLVERVGTIQKHMDAAVGMRATLGRLLYGVDVYRDISVPLQRLDRELAAIEQGQGPAGRFLKDPSSYEEARRKIAGLRRAVDDLGASRFVSSDELYVAWNRRVASLVEAVDNFNSGQGATGAMLVSTRLYESLAGGARELQSQLRDFRSDPRKFLRIGLGIF